MIQTNKGLYFAQIRIDEAEIEITLDEEIFFKNEWVKAAIETEPEKILACIMGDTNLYVIDRRLNLILRTIENITLDLSSLVMRSVCFSPNVVFIRDKDSFQMLNLNNNKIYPLLKI